MPSINVAKPRPQNQISRSSFPLAHNTLEAHKSIKASFRNRNLHFCFSKFQTMSSSYDENNLPVAPSNYICPLTGGIMSDPVLSIHGTTYERRAILKWIDMGFSHCPMTGKPLTIQDLVSDKKLCSVIAGWKDVHDYDELLAEVGDIGSRKSMTSSTSSNSLSSASASASSDEEEIVEKLGLLAHTPMALSNMEARALEAIRSVGY